MLWSCEVADRVLASVCHGVLGPAGKVPVTLRNIMYHQGVTEQEGYLFQAQEEVLVILEIINGKCMPAALEWR